jgi:hypothetical protein
VRQLLVEGRTRELRVFAPLRVRRVCERFREHEHDTNVVHVRGASGAVSCMHTVMLCFCFVDGNRFVPSLLALSSSSSINAVQLTCSFNLTVNAASGRVHYTELPSVTSSRTFPHYCCAQPCHLPCM